MLKTRVTARLKASFPSIPISTFGGVSVLAIEWGVMSGLNGMLATPSDALMVSLLLLYTSLWAALVFAVGMVVVGLPVVAISGLLGLRHPAFVASAGALFAPLTGFLLISGLASNPPRKVASLVSVLILPGLTAGYLLQISVNRRTTQPSARPS